MKVIEAFETQYTSEGKTEKVKPIFKSSPEFEKTDFGRELALRFKQAKVKE